MLVHLLPPAKPFPKEIGTPPCSIQVSFCCEKFATVPRLRAVVTTLDIDARNMFAPVRYQRKTLTSAPRVSVLGRPLAICSAHFSLRSRSASSMSPNVNVLTVSAVATTGFSSDFSGSAWTENQNCLASASQCGQLKASRSIAGGTYFPRTSSMSSSGAEPLLPAGRFAPHRREQPGAILGTSLANSACAIACRSMVYRWLRIQVPPSALQCIALAMKETRSLPRTIVPWPAPGSEDTELGVLMEPEVGH